MPQTKTQTTVTQQTQPVLVKETITKRKRGWGMHPISNTVGCIISILSVAVIIFLVLSVVFLGLWLRTWSVFTQERTVGYITVGPLQTDENCKSYFSLSFEGEDLEAAFGRVFPWGDKVVKKESFTVNKVYGDSFSVFASFFQWKDWLTFLGTPPLYKISSIRSTYYYSADYNTYKNCTQSIPVNGGEDKFWEDVVEGKSFWNFGANATYVSNPTEKVTNQQKKYAIVVTQTTIILKEAQ